ncbi:ankyrin, partial [Rhizoclosmatium globosum]
GRTPLHLAALKGSIEAVKILLKYGADVNARNNSNWTPLHWAINHSIALLLMDHGANVDALSANVDQICDYGTPLFVASKENRLEHALLLISFDANVNAVHNGKSALSVAAERGHLDMVKLLVE